MSESKQITVSDLANSLSQSERHVRRTLRAGKIPCRYGEGPRRKITIILDAALAKWIADQNKSSNALEVIKPAIKARCAEIREMITDQNVGYQIDGIVGGQLLGQGDSRRKAKAQAAFAIGKKLIELKDLIGRKGIWSAIFGPGADQIPMNKYRAYEIMRGVRANPDGITDEHVKQMHALQRKRYKEYNQRTLFREGPQARAVWKLSVAVNDIALQVAKLDEAQINGVRLLIGDLEKALSRVTPPPPKKKSPSRRPPRSKA